MSKFSDKVDEIKENLPECPKCGKLKSNKIHCKTKLCNVTVTLRCMQCGYLFGNFKTYNDD